jgi:uncharacterized protein YndB with AHSA1/START domain
MAFIVNKEGKTVTMDRVINAPRELVWKAYSSSELISQWWGPREYETVVDTLEFKQGGKWRFVHRKEETEEEYGFHGEYKEINEPAKIVWTFEWEGMPGHVLIETITFEDMGEKTNVISVSQYEDIKDLEGMVNMDMESGATQSMDRLQELVTKMK